MVVLVVKNLPANARDLTNVGLIPGLGRSPTWNYNKNKALAGRMRTEDGG